MALTGTRFVLLSTVFALGCGGTIGDRGPGAGHGGHGGEGTDAGAEAEAGVAGRGTGGHASGGDAGDGGEIQSGGAGGSGAGGSGGRSPVVENHRAKGEVCDDQRAASSLPPLPGPDAGGTWPYLCTSDAECTNGSNGRCSGNGHDGWKCTYDECFTDADCHRTREGGVELGLCACSGAPRSDNNTCLYAGNCLVDADCGPPGEGFCSPSFGYCGNYNGVVGYFCHTPDDECTNDADCGSTGKWNDPYCAYAPAVGHFVCSTINCVG